MMEILFISGQILCLAAVVYGGYLVITHVARIEVGRLRGHEQAAGAKEDMTWQKYRHFDS